MVAAGDAVDDLRVPVVEHGREVVQEDHGHAAALSELTIYHPSILHLDRPGGSILECLGHGHGLSLACLNFFDYGYICLYNMVAYATIRSQIVCLQDPIFSGAMITRELAS